QLLFPTVQYWHTMDNTNLYFESRMMAKPSRATTRANTLQIRRFASQTKPLQACHPSLRSGSLSGERSFAALRMTSLMVSYLQCIDHKGLPLLWTLAVVTLERYELVLERMK
ncbi:MAG: hypothetical protein ACJ8CB_19105, partial [Ktedonobacteraceae bacterium]